MAEALSSLSCPSFEIGSSTFQGDGENAGRYSESESVLTTKSGKERHISSDQEEELATEFLRLRNDAVRPMVTVAYEEDDPTKLETVSLYSRSAPVAPNPSPEDVHAIHKRKKSGSDQAKLVIPVPSWQQEFLDLTKQIVAMVERWDHAFEVASNAMAVPQSPQSESDRISDTRENYDITTLLYLVGIHVSWLEPEPKDVHQLLISVFSSLSRLADLCVTIINMVGNGLKRLKLLKPVLQEMEDSMYDKIKSLRTQCSKSGPESILHFRQPSTSKTSAAAVPRSVNSLAFIIQQKHNVALQTTDCESRTVETQSQRLNTEQKILLINTLLDTISHKLNTGFKSVGRLELNQPHKHLLYKLKNDILPRFLGEGKRIRRDYNFSIVYCCRDLQVNLQKLHLKTMEHGERLNGMLQNARWILLALESINHQRKIWAYPFYEINHLEQVAKYGVPKGKFNFLAKKLSFKSIFAQKSFCDKILPFEKMFDVFLLPPARAKIVKLSIEVDNSISRLLFQDIEAETKKYYTSTIFLSRSDLTDDPVSEEKSKNEVLYLKERRPISATSSLNPFSSPALTTVKDPRLASLVKSSEHIFWTQMAPRRNTPSLL